MSSSDLLESLGAVWLEATGSPFDVGEVGQATMAYAEKNPKRFLFLVFIYFVIIIISIAIIIVIISSSIIRFLFLIFIFIYFVVYNWPLVTIIIYLFCCLIYQVVQDDFCFVGFADYLMMQEMEMEGKSKTKESDDWFIALWGSCNGKLEIGIFHF